MFRKGDIVNRIQPSLEGAIVKGTRCIVKRILNSREMTLEGHEGVYLQSGFALEVAAGENRQMSDLEQLEEALSVIDNWNRTHPTALMISIEAAPAQDGGNLYATANFDTNNISALMGHLVESASDEDKAALLERAAQALRYGA